MDDRNPEQLVFLATEADAKPQPRQIKQWAADSRLKAILDHTSRKSPIIALNSRDRPWTESGFRASFFKLLRKLQSDGKIGSGLTFHGLRHTVGKALAEAGCSPRDIASVLGQKSEAAARIYPDEENRRKRASTALKKLERRRPKNIAATENV